MDRAHLKRMASSRISQNRWPAVGVMFIAMLLGGGSSVFSFVSNLDSSNLFSEQSYSYGNYSHGVPDTNFWGVFAGVMLGTMLLIGILGLAYSIFVGNVISIGKDGWFLRYIRGENASVGALFDGFKIYKPVMSTGLLRSLYVWLWSLLFVIPGIVMGYAYSMAGYVIYENPNLTASQALDISKRMTQGYKGELFVLDLSFIGWNLLSGITLGLVGLFHANPYYAASHAHFYEALKAQALSSGRVSPAEFGMVPPVNTPYGTQQV